MDMICVECNKKTVDRCGVCRIPLCDNEVCDGEKSPRHTDFCERPPPPPTLQKLFAWLQLDIMNSKLAGRELPQYSGKKGEDPVLLVPMPGPIEGDIPSFVVGLDNTEVREWARAANAEASWYYFVRMDLLYACWLRFKPSQRNEIFSIMVYTGEELVKCFQDLAIQVGNVCTEDDVENLKKQYRSALGFLLPQVKTGVDFFTLLAVARAEDETAVGMISFRELYVYKPQVVSKEANDKIRGLMEKTEILKQEAIGKAKVRAKDKPYELSKFGPVPPSHTQKKV